MRTAVRPSYDAGEGADKAFWISFADLMTALMVLFLMVMAVALLSITRTAASTNVTPTSTPSPVVSAPVADQPAPPKASDTTDTTESDAIKQLMKQLAQAVDATPGVQLDARRHVIDFGDRARFPTGSHRLDADSAKLLRQFVPQLLAVTDSELGRRWVSRVVVEGFADSRGDYLFNLNLSLQRAQRVLCALLNSYVANYLVRRRVATHVTVGIISRLPVPLVTRESPWFDELFVAAATLEGGDDAAAAAVVQAAAAQAYGLSEDDLVHVLGTFPLVPADQRAAGIDVFVSRTRQRSCR